MKEYNVVVLYSLRTQKAHHVFKDIVNIGINSVICW